jgi:hypothetical protein
MSRLFELKNNPRALMRGALLYHALRALHQDYNAIQLELGTSLVDGPANHFPVLCDSGMTNRQ